MRGYGFLSFGPRWYVLCAPSGKHECSLSLSLPLNPSEGIRAAFVRRFYRWFEKWGCISCSEETFILGCSQRKGQVQITSVPSGALRISDTQYMYPLTPCIQLIRTDGQGVHIENFGQSVPTEHDWGPFFTEQNSILCEFKYREGRASVNLRRAHGRGRGQVGMTWPSSKRRIEGSPGLKKPGGLSKSNFRDFPLEKDHRAEGWEKGEDGFTKHHHLCNKGNKHSLSTCCVR